MGVKLQPEELRGEWVIGGAFVEQVSSSNWLCLYFDNECNLSTPPRCMKFGSKTHLRPTIVAAVAACLRPLFLVIRCWRLPLLCWTLVAMVIRACFPPFCGGGGRGRIFPERRQPQRLSWQFLLSEQRNRNRNRNRGIGQRSHSALGFPSQVWVRASEKIPKKALGNCCPELRNLFGQSWDLTPLCRARTGSWSCREVPTRLVHTKLNLGRASSGKMIWYVQKFLGIEWRSSIFEVCIALDMELEVFGVIYLGIVRV